eukprot:CAMPEP_0175900710 /NCGR_PEP_ID=MMETSP0108-20121206/2476_1 /TAXON_ID=195067 ORGANISM="Goniomonas pacifica, Strain CCMP1869" /NCGR_SAMPLE_ID=MMETSP0108 /ASSEMBLY_ACC=CAM_ASM_000204 /LENGTH=113 /DNA_ID=CAMNT_0017222249 /DNA_START=64 /DNA_END=405 /DNA_ORIENTATION=+
MLLLGDFAANYAMWSSVAVIFCVNTVVHVVTYSYYGLTSLGYSPPWKQLVTQIQIAQFLVLQVHVGIGWLFFGFCKWANIYGLIMIALFLNFYHRTYRTKPKATSVNDGDKRQ